jgi:hypothetical protein
MAINKFIEIVKHYSNGYKVYNFDYDLEDAYNI